MFYLMLLMSCPPTKMLNVSKYEWNAYDMKILNVAEKRCGELYKEARCVALFRKYGKQDYTVLCGEEK